MPEPLVVHHRLGTVSIEGGEVVIRMAGTKGGLFRSEEPWSREMRIPVGQATAEADGPYLTLYRSGRAIQAVSGCPPREAEAFLDALDDAKLISAVPASPTGPVPTHSQCAHCGAQAQLIGQPCRYCGSTERKGVMPSS
jgi:hypothetical protein